MVWHDISQFLLKWLTQSRMGETSSKFYNRDVIKMTITWAKGEGNGHFYHIEVIELPCHRIPSVSYFTSLIDNTKKQNILLKNYTQNCDDLRGLNFAGQSIFS